MVPGPVRYQHVEVNPVHLLHRPRPMVAMLVVDALHKLDPFVPINVTKALRWRDHHKYSVTLMAVGRASHHSVSKFRLVTPRVHRCFHLRVVPLPGAAVQRLLSMTSVDLPVIRDFLLTVDLF